MYYTDKGIEELADRRGADEVTLGWLARLDDDELAGLDLDED